MRILSIILTFYLVSQMMAKFTFLRFYAYTLSVLQFNTNILVSFGMSHQMWNETPINIYPLQNVCTGEHMYY